MNQTRLFLIFAWLMVATLLWMEWNKEQAAPEPVTSSQSVQPAVPDSSVPGAPAAPGVAATGGSQEVPGVPAMRAAQAEPPSPAAAAGSTDAVQVRTDVLSVALNGGAVLQADLLRYPSTAEDDSPPVRLFSQDPADFFVAQSGWVRQGAPAPSHLSGFELDRSAALSGTEFTLAAGSDELVVPFVWHGPDGVSIRRTYTFRRGVYVVDVRDEVVNQGSSPWQGFAYRQLARVPRALESSAPMSPEKYSFQGGAWFTAADKYEKRKYDDFVDDGPLDKASTGGWIAFLQHHFFGAWIPAASDEGTFSLDTSNVAGATRYVVRDMGNGVNVAPGTSAVSEARLWVGPKLVNQIQAQNVPGLDRAVDFSRFAPMAALAGWLFWVLQWLHGLLGNWGWSIVGLVVLLKAVMFPLSAAQYKSMAKMRKFQPRMAQLKERYGDDKQKLQQAMMELYKKEKINPVGGCLPLLLQMPVFLALYWMLSESVELRHAPWILWIQDLTARDPFFVLPVINIALMWATQKLNPMTGVDPMQQKMMQFMPLVFGVMFAFFPAGLVLYWVTNAGLGLIQQWWMIKKYSEPAPAKA
ncbi:membrane protein insertase YidC [Lysobacter sp. A03]|uniref:membrane protein insertase YidC n=1 Tax=Lysobacter sp. A03 TaxID=1199154 RepID=UPI0005B72635|nr:membrane protein insertase YidC [Lysobacter sp. A03]KIQ98197.1 Inner membrane protein translocase component YidC, long form [Lysobacter sp. A03]